MNASVVVPVLDQALLTRICLASLQLADLCDVEVIVVDNGSTDETPYLLAQWADGERRRFLRSQENLNFGPGCNWGASEARGEFLVFLNNDTFVLANWLPALLQPFSDAAVMVAGSRLLYPNGRIQHAGVAFDGHGPYHIFTGMPCDCPLVLEARDCQAVTGAALAIRRREFERLGGFDPVFQNSGEDIDLCLRVKQGGGRIRYAPDSVAYHFESMTEGRERAEVRNLELLKERWAGYWQEDLLPLVAKANAAGYELGDRQLPPAELTNRFRAPEARKQRIAQLEAREQEMNQLWSQLREQQREVNELARLRWELEQVQSELEQVRPLYREVDELRATLNMRSVRAALRARGLFRRIVPAR